MSWPKIVISLVAISALGACSVKSKPNPNRPKPACPTANDQSLAPDRTIVRKTIDMTGTRQRVIHRNCSGKVVSDKIRTDQASTPNGIKIPPSRPLTDAQAQGFNRTTCNTIREDAWHNMFSFGNRRSNSEFRFSPHTSPTFFGSGRVKKNADNYIDYEFTRCVERSADGQTCARTETLEKGTLILTVNYTERTIDEPLEIKDVCEQKP